MVAKNMNMNLMAYLIWECDGTELMQMVWWSAGVFKQSTHCPQKQNADRVFLSMAEGELIAACEVA